MSKYNPIYRKFIDDRNVVMPKKMVKGKFYLIKEYEYVDGQQKKFIETNAPIVFSLFSSVTKDIIHCVKVSNVSPILIKKFFGKLINEKTELLELKGTPNSIYSKIVSKIPAITTDAYRTYKISGIKKVIELDMDINKLTPTNINAKGINSKYQVKNK